MVTSVTGLGRHLSRRRSSAGIRNSDSNATTARITIAAKTPLALKVAPAVWISRPMPWYEPTNSPTTAPTSAKLKLVCRLAKIHVRAEGMITAVVMRCELAPRKGAIDLAHSLKSVEKDDEEDQHGRQRHLGLRPQAQTDSEKRGERNAWNRI